MNLNQDNINTKDIHITYGFLSETDLNLLDDLCINFNADDIPDENKENVYYRMKIDKETHFINYQNIIKDYIHKKYNFNVEISAIWINKITTETNKKDKFHIDKCDFTIISFINDNFEGGEFESKKAGKSQPTEKTKPKRNLNLFTTGEIPHRVLPVILGERYTLIVACKILIKKNDIERKNII